MSVREVERCAIMTVDPGGKTGIAYGWFNLAADSVGSCIARAKRKGSITAIELAGDPIAQGVELHNIYLEFVFRSHVELQLPYDAIHVVFEDFQLRQKHADLAPVKITAAFDSLLREKISKKQITKKSKKTDHAVKLRTISQFACYVIPTLQSPSNAMTYATNDRLRAWDAWIVGSEHARDAMRHLCLKINALLE